MRTLKSDDISIASSYNSIGEVHRKKGNYARALKSYEKALIIWKKSYGEDRLDVAMCLNNMGNVYQDEENYSRALECL